MSTRIANPLADIPRESLLADVERFAAEKGLNEHVNLLKKGALVAQDPGNYENMDLEEDEKEALRIEVTRKWKHPMLLYVTIFTCSIGAAVQGWDQVSIRDNHLILRNSS